MHSLLRRQLKRMKLDREELSPALDQFVEAIDRAYKSFDEDRAMLERSLELSSTELGDINTRLRSILKTIPDLYLWIDSDGCIKEVKQGKTEACPFSGQLLRKYIQDLLSTDATHLFEQNLLRSREAQEVCSFEFRTFCGPTPQTFEVRVIPTNQPETLIIFRDVTRKKQEDEMRLRQSKLDSVGLLAGGIAHDFNNILTVISGGVSICSMEVDPVSEVAEILGDIETSVNRARQLTLQLLTFSKGGSPVREAASIGDLIRESVQFALHGSNVRSEVQIPEDLWPVMVDSGQINQVLNNLVINADQAMKSGGLLQVHAENVEETNQIRILFSDEGTGISEEHLARIFDPYFTTKSSGSGLGLASCYAIINKHGGSINVRSTMGSGTAFEILLPRSEETPQTPTIVLRSPQKGHGRILVMDDEARIRDLAKRMLARLGYECVTAADGYEAISLYQTALHDGDEFYGVIMDLTIPGGLGGRDTLAQILQFDPLVRAIASSGYSNDPVLSEFELYGFVGRLPKPYNIRELGQALECFDYIVDNPHVLQS